MTLGRYSFRLAFAGATLSVALAAHGADTTANAPADAAQRARDYKATVDTLSDIRSAIADITAASGAPWSGPQQYKAAAQRVLVVLEGAQPEASQSDSAGSGGTMGRIEHLLDRAEERPWEPVMEGALANLRAATLHLHDAADTRSLDDYNEAMSAALENLEVAQGRPGDPGVLGGVSGAAANTELAIPPHAKTLDGCRVPHEPGYGVRDGYLAYRAVPLGEVRAQPLSLGGGESVRMAGDLLVIYTAAAPLVKQRCEQKQ